MASTGKIGKLTQSLNELTKVGPMSESMEELRNLVSGMLQMLHFLFEYVSG